MSAQENSVPVILRPHTILGVCEAIGEDFSFNPAFLRIPLAASVLISPTYAIGGYLLLGLIVLLSRILSPKKTATVVETEEAVAAPEANEVKAELPLAA